MELGGNDAAIVLPDADPRAVATGVFWGAFLNMGQTCAAIKRLYVHEDLHDASQTRVLGQRLVSLHFAHRAVRCRLAVQ